jgi:hypothetical protein
MPENTPCIRCGKTRIVAKSWNEHIGNSLVTYVNTVCPDPECQKIVDEQLKKKKEKIEAIHRESVERKEQNKRNKKIRKK